MKSFTVVQGYRQFGAVLRQGARDGAVEIRGRDVTWLLRISALEPDLLKVRRPPRGRRPRISPTATVLLRRLNPSLMRLPARLQELVWEQARRPQKVRVQKLARATGMTRRSLDRAFAQAGFDGSARMLKGVLVAAVWDVLARSPRRRSAVARQVGLTPRMVSRQIGAYTGVRSLRRDASKFTPKRVARLIAKEVIVH